MGIFAKRSVAKILTQTTCYGFAFNATTINEINNKANNDVYIIKNAYILPPNFSRLISLLPKYCLVKTNFNSENAVLGELFQNSVGSPNFLYISG